MQVSVQKIDTDQYGRKIEIDKIKRRSVFDLQVCDVLVFDDGRRCELTLVNKVFNGFDEVVGFRVFEECVCSRSKSAGIRMMTYGLVGCRVNLPKEVLHVERKIYI